MCFMQKPLSLCHATNHALRDREWRTLQRASVTARNWILLFFVNQHNGNHELIFLCCRYHFQDRVNMYCDMCKTRKLRREFPLDTMTEKCDHAPLHCLRVSIKLKENQRLPVCAGIDNIIVTYKFICLHSAWQSTFKSPKSVLSAPKPSAQVTQGTLNA